MLNLENTEATSAPDAVMKMRDLLFRADFNGLSNQGVLHGFVPMAKFCNDVNRPKYLVALEEFHETNEFSLVIGADERSAFGKRTKILLNDRCRLPVVPEFHALADGRFVINGLNAFCQLIIQRHRSQLNPALLRFPDLIANLEMEAFPPLRVPTAP